MRVVDAKPDIVIHCSSSELCAKMEDVRGEVYIAFEEDKHLYLVFEGKLIKFVIVKKKGGDQKRTR